MTSILERGIYNAHCLEFLERIPDSTAQVVYLDPPTATQVAGILSRDEYRLLIEKTVRQTHRVLRPQGSVHFQTTQRNALFVRQVLLRYFDEEQFLYETSLLNVRGEVEYVIGFAHSEAAKSRPIYKPVTDVEFRHFQKDRNGKLFRYDDLTTNRDRPNLQYEFMGETPRGSWKYSIERMKEFETQGLIDRSPSGRLRIKRYLTPDNSIEVGNDWSDVPGRVANHSDEFTGFATQRPEELLRRIIMSASDPGDLILDPFSGSGTSFVVAHRTDRLWVGCDLDRDAYLKAITRLESELQLIPERDYQTGDSTTIAAKYPVVRSSAFDKYFISYKREDMDNFVRPFCAKLDRQKIDYWLDQQDIQVGDRWQERLDQGVAECAAVVLFITPAALDSEYVDREWRAFAEAGKSVYPLVCIPTHTPAQLRQYQFLAYDEHDRLVERMKTFGGRS